MAKLSKIERDLLERLMKQKESAMKKKTDQRRREYAGIKKRKVKRKVLGPKRRARDLVEEFGLCPISLQPMRRPVLPSSGIAYDEVNIVRFSSSGGKKQCPVTGAALECHRKGSDKGKIVLTPDYALRNVIRHQAIAAKVYIPPLDKEEVLKELRALLTDASCPVGDFQVTMPAIAKAVVDDTFLGYITVKELQGLLSDFCAASECSPVSCGAGAFAALVAECLACREADIVALGVQYLASDAAWSCSRALQEALSVGQDPDCRGKVLLTMESKFKDKCYTFAQAKKVLTFETESVPVQQFQARCADHILFTNNIGLQLTKGEVEEVLNLALRVADELSGCDCNRSSGHALWSAALLSLQRRCKTLDKDNIERLFWRNNRAMLSALAANDRELLLWHLSRQPSTALSLCIDALADYSGFDDGQNGHYYSDEEDFLGSDDDDDEPPSFHSGLPRLHHLATTSV